MSEDQDDGGFKKTEEPIDTTIHFHCPHEDSGGSGEATIQMGGRLDMMARGTLAILDRLGQIAKQDGVIKDDGEEGVDNASAAMLLMREVHKNDAGEDDADNDDEDEQLNVH